MDINDFIKRVDSKIGATASICFLGFGVSNRALYKSLKNDEKRRITIRSESIPTELPDGVRIYVGKEHQSDISEDILFLSPSVRRESAQIRSALERGSIVTSDAELYFLDVADEVYAITGSDGKSTTSYLVAKLLGSETPIGNYGIPFARAEAVKAPHVIELSSFMLQYLSPRVKRALITNITPNHLDWHEGFEEYVSAKLRVYDNAEHAVLCADDAISSLSMKGRHFFAVYSNKKSRDELIKQYDTEYTVTLEGGCICVNGKAILSKDRLFRKEGYNLSNFLGAVSMTLEKAGAEDIAELAESFRGLPHRCEVFAEYKGITFIDSSIDTTPARAAATINSINRPIKILLGGRGKELDAAPLINALARRAEKIAFYGKEGEKLFLLSEREKRLSCIPRSFFSDFDSAVEYLITGLKDQDTVVLAPAATSYGEFKNFSERGDRFKAIIYSYINSLKYKK